MATRGIPLQAKDSYVAAFRAGIVTVAAISGILALVALAAGSPLQFGLALASFGAAWIAADFLASRVERGRATQPCMAPIARPYPGYRSRRVVYFVGDESFSQPHALHR
ncbi:MAG TPA: hypothetical protein VME67_18830 [Mycobacterium sp.]|nr:hypothetical protein [Mycobacterium sp.]HTX96725.1 hypothetical protein [Mycobacterium sp.]